MTGSSILPVTIHQGKIYFLFGKECEKEDSAKGFSDFGGGIESGEDIYEAALREGAEELTGFLGNSENIRKHINTHGGVYKINHHSKYYVHLFYLPYNPDLPKYYNINHQFLYDRMDNDYLYKTKLFEKSEIHWFSITETKQRISEFRNFYQKIVHQILSNIPSINRFLKKCMNSIECLRDTKKKKVSMNRFRRSYRK
jgi:8-oxo-dGTP pyrophosphatase MutT (NUDIX family)